MSLASLQALTLSGPGGNLVAIVAARNQSQDRRLDAFLVIAARLTDQEYWETLGNIWIEAGFPGYRGQEWFNLFCSSRSGRWFLMNEAERQFLTALPEKVQVYRAATEDRRNGISWTLDLNVARLLQSHRYGWKARPADDFHQKIWTTVLNRAEVFAYFNRHDEREIVVLDHKGIELYQGIE